MARIEGGPQMHRTENNSLVRNDSFTVSVSPKGELRGVRTASEDIKYSAIARLHILHEYLAAETKRVSHFDLSTAAGRLEASKVIDNVKRMADSVPAHLESDFSSYLRAPKERRLVAKINEEIAKIDIRLVRCQQEIAKIEDIENQKVLIAIAPTKGRNRIQRIIDSARQKFGPYVGALTMVAPVISGAAFQTPTIAHEFAKVPTTLDGSRGLVAHEPNENEVDQVLSEFFSNITNINDLIDGLERAVSEILGTGAATAEANDLSLLEKRFTSGDNTSNTDDLSDLSLSEQRFAANRVEARQEEVANSFEIPVFTLDSDTGAKLSAAISTKEIPTNGIAISLPDESAFDSAAFFESNPELITQIHRQTEVLNHFKSLGGNGELQLIVKPNLDGTFKTAVIISITQAFTEGDVDYTAGSIWGTDKNFIINTDRQNMGIESVVVVGFASEAVADFATEGIQSEVAPIEIQLGTLVLSEVKTDTRERITIVTEKGPILLIKYVARANQKVNLRSQPTTDSDKITSGREFTLLTGDRNNYKKIVGDLPLQTEINGVGVYFGQDGILLYLDGNDKSWVAATSPNGENGWVSGEVVTLETVTPEPVPIPDFGNEDIQTTATMTPPDAAGTQDPNALTDPDVVEPSMTVVNPDSRSIFGYTLPENVQAQPFDEAIKGHTTIENGKTLVYRENLAQNMEVTDVLTTSYGTLTLERATTSPYGNGEQERVVTFDQNMETHAEAGMRQFYLELYKEAFDVDDAQAEQLLLVDTPIPLNVLVNSENFLKQGWMTPLNSRTLNIIPSAGMSITFIEHLPYPRVMNGPRPLNNTLAETAFTEGPGGKGDVIIASGTSVWINPDGRIILISAINYRNATSLGLTGSITDSVDYVLRSVGPTPTDSEATPNPPQRTDYVKSQQPTKNIFAAFNVPMTAESRNLTLAQWEEHHLVRVSE